MARPKASAKRVTTNVKRVIATDNSAIDSRSLLQEILQEWGGPKALAQDIFQEFRKAKPGGMTRQSLLEMIQRLIVWNTNQSLSNPIDHSELDDEDLETIVQENLAKIQAKMNAGTGDE
jgi:hypothetical protein